MVLTKLAYSFVRTSCNPASLNFPATYLHIHVRANIVNKVHSYLLSEHKVSFSSSHVVETSEIGQSMSYSLRVDIVQQILLDHILVICSSTSALAEAENI